MCRETQFLNQVNRRTMLQRDAHSTQFGQFIAHRRYRNGPKSTTYAGPRLENRDGFRRIPRRKSIGRERSGYPCADDGDVDGRAIYWSLASPTDKHANTDSDRACRRPCHAEINGF